MARTTGIAALAVITLMAVVAYRSGASGQEDQTRQKRRAEAPSERRDAMQCPMMAGLKGIELHSDSAAALLGQKEELKLTEEQIERLKQVQETGRRQAREVLTDQQRQQLPERDGPLSMMELCMQRMKDQRDGQAAASMCPMCARMMQMRQAEQQVRERQKP